MSIVDIVSYDVQQDARNYCVIVLAVARENDRDIRWVREVRQTHAAPYLLIMVLRRKRQRVIDAIGIPVIDVCDSESLIGRRKLGCRRLAG